MTFTVEITIAAAAAEALPHAFDGSAHQWWVDVLASALSGLVHLPIAIFFVWLFHRFRLNRWLVVTALLATLLSVIVTGILDLFVGKIYSVAQQMLVAVGLNRFGYMLMPNLLVCLVGAIVFAWWFKHRPRVDEDEISQ